jgi:hypothetical protein
MKRRQDHSEFRPGWYESELDRLARLEEHPQARTWAHPTDVIFLIALVLVLIEIFCGGFS